MSNPKVKNIKTEFAYRTGARVSGVAAEVAGKELQRIQAKNGGLTAPIVLDEARPEHAKLHPAFEWRDEKAAEEYRLYQARNLIRSVQVITEGKSSSVYAHVPKTTTEAGSYQPMDVVVRRPDLFALALQELTEKMQQAINAVESLKAQAEATDPDNENRMMRIAIAVQAMQTASAAVHALH